MIPKKVFFVVLLIPAMASAQRSNEKQSGNFSIGMRSALSAFSHGGNELGYGAGGQCRIQLLNRVNTEWFLDVLSTNIEDQAQRLDYHIGWSVMYYVIDPKAFTRVTTPYVVAGHCFDHTRVSINGSGDPARVQWSSAVQAGVGTHFNITPKFDISPTVQYMFHLGKELHAHVSEGEVVVEEHQNAGWQGHLLFNISVNYKFFKLWKPRKS